MSELIARPAALWLAVAPVDLRLGADGLSLYVQQVLQADPCAGHAYLFRNKRATA
ncbi:MAG: IS66 family insertion sequence element accessory protein TnpB [Methylococcaceae bacterium]|nr:IS66 family insertion sequence element accessory protein TnpB [Methylococcaceae bacterium]